MKIGIVKFKLPASILALFLVQLCACTQPTPKYSTAELNYVDLSDEAQITAQPVKTTTITLSEAEGDEGVIRISLDTLVHSNLSGIGGAFNEQGGEAFMSLPEASRKALAEALFNPATGSGFSLCRTAVGSSDFGLSAYSYSETPEDYNMEHFSVERDTKSVIPFILAAQAENPDLVMFASPWSPPGWMKVSGKMDGGKASPETNILRATPEIYQAYALYFSKYIQAYAQNGINIHRLVVQNETDMNPPYPGCDMKPEEMANLISNYIQPQFAKDGINTEVWAGSFRGKRSDAQNFMKLENANDAVGLGLQYCPQFVLKELRENYPDLKMMHTEGRCENGNNSMVQARKRFGEMASWINMGCENYCFWNMVLNETSTSGWDWKQNSLVNIDRNTGKVTYNPDYAPVSLLSRYIRPGDQALKVETKKGAALAIRNSERLVVFLQNNAKAPATRYIQIEGKTYSAEVPAQSLCALVFKN